MWSARTEELTIKRGVRFKIDINSQPATFEEVLSAWQNDAEFRSFFNALLADSPFQAFRWETPPISKDSVSRTFEFVLLDCPGLARRPDKEAFEEHFLDSQEVVAFANLGRDATLIVPCPLTHSDAYGHLAAFVRLAPESQQHALWQLVGERMSEQLEDKPLWLSTAGGGVSWLHVRIDSVPKYYGYQPYRAIARG